MQINQDVFIHQGISDTQISQLIEYSHTDSEIKKFTSDPVRFKDRNAFDQWLLKGRVIYTLSDKDKNLLGIVKFGHKNPPVDKTPANFTFAIRIYELARGQGLSSKFMKITFKDFFKNHQSPIITGIWLETSCNNLAAINAYQKFGFKTVSQDGDSLIMVL
jgi:ribosomal protein S18 acetylase RimI-like enzyme